MKIIYKLFILLLIPLLLITKNYALVGVSIIIYSLFDFRYPLFFIPCAFLNEDLRISSIFLIIIGLSMVLRKYYTYKKHYILIFALLSETLIYVTFSLFLDLNIYIAMIEIATASLLLCFLLCYIHIYYVNNENVVKINNVTMFQSIFILLITLGIINRLELLVMTVCLFFTLYLTLLKHKSFSLIYGILLFFLFKESNINYVYLIIPCIYQLKKYYPIIITLGLIILDLLYTKLYTDQIYGLILSVVLTFELFKPLMKNMDYFKNRYSSLNMYDNIINNFNDQVLKFASFLDEFERKFITDRETKIKFNEAYTKMLCNYCQNCKKDCYKTNKTETYNFIKNALLYGKNIRVKRDSSLSLSFIENCYYKDEIINNANIIKNKYNFNKEKTITQQSLERQLVGVSNTLRQYVVDLSSKKELHLELLLNLKNRFLDNNYDIILYNVRRIFRDDFWIEVGLSKITKHELSVIKKEAEKCLNTKVSIEVKKENGSIIYFSIIPEINYRVLYGAGTITKEDLNIGGDNYLIKDLDTGLFIAALSDGMGSGKKAYNESKDTLDLLDKITSFEVNPNTSINILNTFYSLKENMDQYATLDFLEINKCSGEGILFKMGSSNTFLVRNSSINVLYNENLPFGINDLIVKNQIQVEDKDCIILASDGICDHISESELEKCILLSLHKNAQEIAYDILNKLIHTNNKALDDMSIVVLQIEKIKR